MVMKKYGQRIGFDFGFHSGRVLSGGISAGIYSIDINPRCRGIEEVEMGLVKISSAIKDGRYTQL
jgi:hypothetical protein